MAILNFKLIMGEAEGDFVEVLAKYCKPCNCQGPSHGDRFLIIERPLIDPNANKQVGTLIARLTFMQVSTAGQVLLLFGNAEHRLDQTPKKGVISVQGSWRTNDNPRVFSIIGGTGDYDTARGSVTFTTLSGGTEEITYNVR
jgi:hypothetical protein